MAAFFWLRRAYAGSTHWQSTLLRNVGNLCNSEAEPEVTLPS